MTFYKDIPILVLLCVIVFLHVAVCLIDLFFKSEKCLKIVRTSLVSANIVLHLCLIAFMMRAHLLLNEAVMVVLISVFSYTLVFFLRFSVQELFAKRAREGEGGEES